MIYSVSGKLISKSIDEAVIEAGGIGFRISIPANVYPSLPEVGSTAFLFTHFIIKEDAFELYGFETKSQKDYFKTLISVSGVGAKIALAVLSSFTPDKISLAIASGDHKAFTSISGIGPKLAQRIVLELKDKIGNLVPDVMYAESVAGVAAAAENDEAMEALIALGFSKMEAAKALSGLPDNYNTEQKITAALRALSKGR